MAIKTPDILPGEKGYISKKEKTLLNKKKEKKERIIKRKNDLIIGKIKTGSKAYRIGKLKITFKGEKKYPIWKYYKKIGDILVKNKNSQNEEIILTFHRFGGIGNFKHLIQDVDFQKRWAIREQELLITQKNCFICGKKISKSAKPNLYHIKMWKKRAKILEDAEKIPEEVVKGKLTIEKGWKKFNDILEEGNRYYMSLKDTALICPTCARNKGLNN